jgi:hypothetical protein
MTRKGRWRQFVTRIAIMSVLMHAVLAALMLPAPLAGAATGAAPQASASAICSLSPRKSAESGEPSDSAGQRLPQKTCPVCDGIATSGFLLELAQTALIGQLTDPTVLRPSVDLPPASIACLAHNNRGPPRPV